MLGVSEISNCADRAFLGEWNAKRNNKQCSSGFTSSTISASAWIDAGNSARTGTAISGSITSTSIAAGSFTSFTLGLGLLFQPILCPSNYYLSQPNSKMMRFNQKWSTASETNNDDFTVERATDLEHFEQSRPRNIKGLTKRLIPRPSMAALTTALNKPIWTAGHLFTFAGGKLRWTSIRNAHGIPQSPDKFRTDD